MKTARLQEQFSADVRLDLLVDGRLIPLAKIGPEYAVLQNPDDVPAGQDAVLIMNVDGREHRWEIQLKEGIVPFDESFSFRVTRYPHQDSLFNPLLS
jgi:hypothetical protein